jgi:DNA-binding transcriptional LysR family regulator
MDKIMQWTDRIGRRLKLQDMHILLAAVQWGSMAKAAEQLAISQPVISRSIASLERALGVRLLDRSRNGVEPTMYGRALLAHSMAAFDELKQGVKAIEFLADAQVGEVRIGTTEVVAGGILSPAVDRMSRQYPRIDFKITVADTPTLQYRFLRQREVDFVLMRLPTTLENDEFDSEALLDDPLYVVTSAQSHWSRRRKIKLAELVNERWFLPPPDSPPGAMMAEVFRTSGLKFPYRSVVTNSIQVTNSMVVEGGFTLFPYSLLRSNVWLPSLKVLPVRLPGKRSPVGIISLKNRTPTPVAKLLTEHLRTVAKALARGSNADYSAAVPPGSPRPNRRSM